MHRVNDFSVFLLVLYITNSLNQVSGQRGFGNPCISQLSCGQCIRRHSDCVWCSEENFSEWSRCDYLDNIKGKCNASHVVLQDGLFIKVKDNELNNETHIVQLKPQRVHLKLRPHTSYTLALEFRNAQDMNENLSSRVELKDTATGSVNVTYYSTCMDGNRIQRNSCSGPNIGTNLVTFEAHIEVASCPKNPKDWTQIFQIYPVGINEELIVKLEMICGCNCEEIWEVEKNSTKCTFGGTYECGICSCNDNRYGRKCECDLMATVNDGCFMPDSTLVCSGRGSCTCGVCECYHQEHSDRKVTGSYCECDNFSCDRFEGMVCGGPERGVCECGICKCNPEWTGSACECKRTIDTCMGENGEICSGHGFCECGRCKCFETEDGRYTGAFCQNCLTCPSLCEIYKDCVQCQMYQTGQLTKDECQNCPFIPIATPKVEIESADERLCTFYDESDDCKFVFKYILQENTSQGVISAQTAKMCPTHGAGQVPTSTGRFAGAIFDNFGLLKHIILLFI